MWLLQKLADAFKVSALKATDVINSIFDPFEDFTRDAEPLDNEFLSLKAERFEEDLLKNFSFFGGKILHYRKMLWGVDDWADQALWHGIYTAMFAFKYKVVNTSRVRDILMNCLDGLDMHQMVGKEPVRRLVRGFGPDNSWTDNCSNDSAGGHLCGIYFAWLYGDDAIKVRCSALIQGIADELINNNWSLINADKTPTKYGVLINGLLTDPLRLALCLAILKVAVKITSMKKYQDAYDLVNRKYNTACLAKYAKAKLITLDTTYDTHRAAFLLTILAECEDDIKLKGCYAAGAMRTWDIVKKQGNSWITFMVHRIAELDATHLQQSVKILKEFSVEAKQAGNVEKINSTNADVWKAKGIRFFKWGSHLVSSQPLPVHMVGQQDFRWQRGQYDVDNWVGSKNPDTIFNGGDFLASYWLGRLLGVVKESD
jgi:hypothetical protein